MASSWQRFPQELANQVNYLLNISLVFVLFILSGCTDPTLGSTCGDGICSINEESYGSVNYCPQDCGKDDRENIDNTIGVKTTGGTSKSACKDRETGKELQKCEDGSCVGKNDCCPEDKCALNTNSCALSGGIYFPDNPSPCPDKILNVNISVKSGILNGQCSSKCRPNCGGSVSTRSNAGTECAPGQAPTQGYLGNIVCSCK